MKVAILGLAESRHEAPWGDPDWEFWCLAHDQENRPRADLLFEMHEKGKGHRSLSDTQAPCYWQYPDDARHLHYPLGEVIETLGRDWFDSSIAYMIAMAIHKKVETIGLWGVHMATETEYKHQRDNLCWVLGIAEGRGIKLEIPESCGLLKHIPRCGYPYRYGYL